MVFSAYWHRKKVFIKRLSILVQLDRLTISRRLTNRLYTRRPQLPPTALQTWRPNPPVIAPTCSSSLTSSNSLLCCLRAPFVLFHFYSHYKTLSNLMPGEVSGRQFVKKKKEEKHNNKHVDNVPRAYHFGHTQLWKAMCRAHCSHSHKKKTGSDMVGYFNFQRKIIYDSLSECNFSWTFVWRITWPKLWKLTASRNTIHQASWKTYNKAWTTAHVSSVWCALLLILLIFIAIGDHRVLP